jgi:hypothetical protein
MMASLHRTMNLLLHLRHSKASYVALRHHVPDRWLGSGSGGEGPALKSGEPLTTDCCYAARSASALT